MKDYTKDLAFWKRLKSFVYDVNVSDQFSEEEKKMILNQCKIKISSKS